MTRRLKRAGPPAVDEHGIAIHRPIEVEPLRHRPDGTDENRGYYGPADPALDQQRVSLAALEPVEAWSARRREADMALFAEALRDVELTEYEGRKLRWLAEFGTGEVVTVASLIDRAYRLGHAEGQAAGIAKERKRQATARKRKKRPEPRPRTDAT